jgi:HK97 family phage major capsid protein
VADVKTLEQRAAAARRPIRSVNEVAPGHAPAVRKGENPLTSRPFSLTKMIGLISKALTKEEASVEYDHMVAFKKALTDTNCVPERASGSSHFYPGSRVLLPHQVAHHKATNEMLLSAGASMEAADPDEMEYLGEKLGGRFKKSYEPQHIKTAMSYLTDLTGGAMVAPPEMGEIIPLMRNMSAVDRAGARMVPLPPQGKWVAPRVASASTGYWIGENQSISQSNPTFGQAEMQAKKLGVLILVPNELFKYASPSADAILREDMAKTLALGYDFSCLYGTSGAQPKGLVFYTGSDEVVDYAATTTPVPAGVATDGNTVQPQDGYLMSAYIEDRNFDLNGWKWLMRPRLWGKTASFRSSSGAVTTADQLGLFVQDLTRALGAGAPAQWCGYPVVRSAQIRNTLTKGSGTGLSELWGGVWSEFLMGMYGAVEFATATQGDTMFAQDQTMIRGILHADAVPRYPGAFVRYKEVIM